MTTNQRMILDYFDAANIGAIFHDRRKAFVWKSDIRDDADLANEIANDRVADLATIAKRLLREKQ